MSLAASSSVRDSLFVICPVSSWIGCLYLAWPTTCWLVYRPLTPNAGHVIASPLFSTTASQVARIYHHRHPDPRLQHWIEYGHLQPDCAVILKPLPFPNSERLVEVCEPYQHHPFSVFDHPNYVDMAAAQHTFDSLALKVERTVDLRTNGEAQLLEADFVSPSLFRVSGLPVILGRVSTEKEDIPNGPLVAIKMWLLRSRCGALETSK
jgi:hypothetical protein